MTLTVEQQRIVEGNLGLVRAVLSRCVSSPRFNRHLFI